jgi:hypothetical protein
MSRPNASRGVPSVMADAKDEIYEYDSSASDSEVDKDKCGQGHNKAFIRKSSVSSDLQCPSCSRNFLISNMLYSHFM